MKDCCSKPKMFGLKIFFFLAVGVRFSTLPIWILSNGRTSHCGWFIFTVEIHFVYLKLIKGRSDVYSSHYDIARNKTRTFCSSFKRGSYVPIKTVL